MKQIKLWSLGAFSILLIGLLLPQRADMPVMGAGHSDYHPDSFWYYPWGRSITHKGVDVFAKEGTDVVAATGGIILYRGELPAGGNVVAILGPKWRVHYYAHLRDMAKTNVWVKRGTPLGTVGTTGNAIGKPPHLHYALATLIPYIWRADDSIQGWKKMFYLNPMDYWPA